MGKKYIEMANGNGICMWNSNMPEIEQNHELFYTTLSKPLGNMTADNLQRTLKPTSRRCTLYQKILRVLVGYFEKGNSIKRLFVKVEDKIVLEGNLKEESEEDAVLGIQG